MQLFALSLVFCFSFKKGCFLLLLCMLCLRKGIVTRGREHSFTLSGEVSLYGWSPVFLFGFSCFVYAEVVTYLIVWFNPKQSNRRSAIQWYFPLWIKWVFSEARLNSILLVIWRCDLTIQPWSSLVEGGEGSYLPNCQTTLVIALDSLSLLFCIFESTTVYHLGRYYLLLLKSSVISVTRFGDFLHFGKLFKGFGNI